MAKWSRIIFLSSLALNVILIVGFVIFRQSMETSIFKINVLNAQAKVTEARHSLHELESGDPNRIAALKKFLWDSIEMSNRETEEYRHAANK